MCEAINIAKWFVNNGYDAPNSRDGNMKLNKLLYFAQLISLIKREKPLFDDDLYAFEHGVVVENVRKQYCNNYDKFISDSYNFEINFKEDEIEVLNLTKLIFGSLNPYELSNLTHEHSCWKDYYYKSECCGWHNKYESIIPLEDILENYQQDLDLVRNIIDAYEENEKVDDEKYIEINEIKYFYNPKELIITQNIIDKLEIFPAEDSAYSLYIDDTQGLVIF